MQIDRLLKGKSPVGPDRPYLVTNPFLFSFSVMALTSVVGSSIDMGFFLDKNPDLVAEIKAFRSGWDVTEIKELVIICL